ncbi:MAG: hypothetical protein ABSC72_13845 [Methylovirgula sp.]
MEKSMSASMKPIPWEEIAAKLNAEYCRTPVASQPFSLMTSLGEPASDFEKEVKALGEENAARSELPPEPTPWNEIAAKLNAERGFGPASGDRRFGRRGK